MNAFRTIWLSARAYAARLVRIIRIEAFDNSTAAGRSDERFRRVGLTTLSSLLAKATAVLTMIISAPLTVGYLGSERYGLWMTITSVIVVLGFADLGMGNGLMNAIIRANGQDDREAARKSVASAFFMLLAVAVFASLTFAAFYPLVPWAQIFNVTSAVASAEAGPTVAVLFACFAVSLPLGTVQRVQIGYQEGFQSGLWQCAASIVGLIALLVAIRLHASLPWLVLSMAGAPLAVTAINWLVQFGYSRPWLFPSWKEVDRSVSRALVSVGASFLILQVLALIGNASDSLVLAHIMGPDAVTEFSFAQRLFSTLLLVQFFIAPLWPAFGDALEKNDHDWAHRTLRRALVLSVSMTALAALPLFFLGKWIITLWVGAEYAPSNMLLASLAAWSVLASYGGVMSALLNNAHFLRKQVIFYGIAAIAALGLKIVLTYAVGISGVAWGTVLGFGIFYVIPAWLLARSTLRIGQPAPSTL